MEANPIHLSIVFPGGEELSVMCGSVRFSVPDSADGRIPGGAVGIRRGHADAMMAVARCEVLAFSGGEKIFSKKVTGGVATVSRDTVMILADGAGN